MLSSIIKYANPSDVNTLVNYNPDCHNRTLSTKQNTCSSNATTTMCICTINYTGYFDTKLDDTILGEMLIFRLWRKYNVLTTVVCSGYTLAERADTWCRHFRMCHISKVHIYTHLYIYILSPRVKSMFRDSA
jgi:hypothetical protein